MHELKDFIEETAILRNGYFSSVGSAKADHGEHILCYAMSMEYMTAAINNPLVSCIITNPKLAKEFTDKSIVVHDEPDILYGSVVNTLIENNQIFPKIEYKIDSSVIIHPTAIVSKKCQIGKNVVIGRNSIIEDYTILEENVIIEDNVVIGCDGFYFKRNKVGELVKFLHAGGVHLHKNVEVMTGSMVQRAHDAIFTTIEEGTKISVNANVGHSAHIGKHNMITGNVQIAGRVKMGDYCWIGTSSTISDSVNIGNYAEIKIGSVVVKDVKENQVVSGSFAYEHTRNLKNYLKAQR